MKTFIGITIVCMATLWLFMDQYELPDKAISLKDPVKTGLPIISITSTHKLSERLKRPAIIELIANDQTQSIPPTPVAIEISGSTSTRFDKKRYSFQFSRSDDWLEGDNISPLGLSKDDDWVLDAAFRDHLLFRNKLNHDLYNKIAKEKRTISSKFVELYFNGEYRGLYVLSEKVGRKLLNIPKSPIYETTYAKFIKFFSKLSHRVQSPLAWQICRILYRTPMKVLRFFTPPKTLPHALYKARPGADLSEARLLTLKYPHNMYYPVANNTDQLISVISEPDKNKFADQIWEILDRSSTIDYLILLLVNGGYDNMTANYLLYYINGRFQLRPWDLDWTFKSIDSVTKKLHAPYNHWPFDGNKLFKRLFRGDAPDFLPALAARFFELRKTTISYRELKAMFEDNFEQVSVGGAIQRDHKRWKLPSAERELKQTLIWLKKRLSFLDQKLKEF